MRQALLLLLAGLFVCNIAMAQPKQPAKSRPFFLGVTEEIQSQELGEQRTLNIYLPDDYKKDDTTRYPVIYLLDGGADEDFIHVVGLVQFNTFPWINRIPKSIVVGISNVDRKRDFTYKSSQKEELEHYPASGHSDKFMCFLEKELQPYIQQQYRTNQSKTLIGQSLAGLFAAEVLLKKPALFNQYIIISPSIWWDNGSLLKLSSPLLEKDFTPETRIYIGVGKEGLTPGSIPHVMEVDANLLAEKIKGSKSNNLKVYFDYLPEEDHATITHQAVFNAFRLLYPVKKQ